ncbi:hypothetical protein CDIK_2215 [Cucumispora dikerogammari]|nr:hypothetical protein CDIK_2215 [Cucumispora dikerogammari]
MAIKNLIFSTIAFRTIFISNTQQTTDRESSLRDPIRVKELITSNNVRDVCRSKEVNKITPDFFELKPKTIGNTFMFSLLSLKNINGEEISEEFGEVLDFNNISLNSKSIDQNEYRISGTLECFIKEDSVSKIHFYGIRLFFFVRPSTNTFYLYIFATLPAPYDIKFTERCLFIGKERLGVFLFKLYIDTTHLPRVLWFNRSGKREKYTIEFLTCLKEIKTMCLDETPTISAFVIPK